MAKSTPVSYSTGQSYVSSYKPTYKTYNSNVVQNATRDLGLSGYKAGSTIVDEGRPYTGTITPRQESLVNKSRNNLGTPSQYQTTSAPRNDPPTYTPTYTPPASSGGESYSAPSYSAPSSSSILTDIAERIKRELEEMKASQQKQFETMYQQEKAANKDTFEGNRNKINLNYERTKRYLNNLHGDAVSGVGLSNKARNMSNWTNQLAENDRNYANNDASALARYNQNVANGISTFTQGLYNQYYPIIRQKALDDGALDFRKYLAGLNI